MTPKQRRINVMMSHLRRYNVVLRLCACRVGTCISGPEYGRLVHMAYSLKPPIKDYVYVSSTSSHAKGTNSTSFLTVELVHLACEDVSSRARGLILV